jgi:hypothetical protein
MRTVKLFLFEDLPETSEALLLGLAYTDIGLEAIGNL